MSDPVLIAFITNGTVILVAVAQGLLHRRHERVSKDTLTEVKKMNGNGGNGKDH